MSEKKKKIKIGLIGCGRISKTHFEAIAALEDAECIACCDIIPERAREAAEKYGIPFWTARYEDMLAIPEIEMISVCTPSGLHPEHGIMAARAGKHVLVEKPMAVRVADADRLIQECEAAGVKLFVCYQNRLNPTIQLLRRAYEEGRFGRIYMIVANVFWHRPQEYYDQAPWRGTWALDGGAFMNQASHYVDMMLWFGGEVAEVKAITGTLARKIEAEDTGTAIIRFKEGAIGSINVTVLTFPQNLEGSIAILGENGTVKVGGTSMNRIERWEFASSADYDSRITSVNTEPKSVYGYGHRGLYKLAIEDITCKPRYNRSKDILPQQGSLCTGIEGRKSVELVCSIYGRH